MRLEEKLRTKTEIAKIFGVYTSLALPLSFFRPQVSPQAQEEYRNAQSQRGSEPTRVFE